MIKHTFRRLLIKSSHPFQLQIRLWYNLAMIVINSSYKSNLGDGVVSKMLKVDNNNTLILRRVLRLCLLGLRGIDKAQEFSLINGGFWNIHISLEKRDTVFYLFVFLEQFTSIANNRSMDGKYQTLQITWSVDTRRRPLFYD